jgi:hypothetical protein
MSDYPKCPKCGHEEKHPEEYFPYGQDDTTAEFTCGECEHEYRVCLTVSYNYEVLDAPGGEG